MITRVMEHQVSSPIFALVEGLIKTFYSYPVEEYNLLVLPGKKRRRNSKVKTKNVSHMLEEMKDKTNIATDFGLLVHFFEYPSKN